MEAYNKFAMVYDLFMEDTPYDEWTQYILKIWDKFGCKPKLVLDLACGTGNITERLAEKGIEMIGIDISEEMLMVAKEKAQRDNKNILYLCQDMCEFELYGTVDSIVCICDSINYLTEDGQFLQVLKLMHNYLHPGGYFIFDINTEYKFKNILSDNSYSVVEDNAAYIWENYYDEEEKINEYHATFFIENEEDKKYERFDEFHYERAYAIDEIKSIILDAGLEFVTAYNELTFDPPSDDSERVFFVVRRA